jgi:hypothetical protein
MAADSPNDKRHILVAMLRPALISLAACQVIGGPRPPAIAVFFDREEHTFSLVDVVAP